jgi:phosphoribosyl 1,2-cyclic phosphodiesterase
LRARIWGCRGSLPTPGRQSMRYGGNTSCVEVWLDDGSLLILDAGTGIRELGLALVESGRRDFHVCLTHLHLDHLEGLAFFAPVWSPEARVHVWGPASPLRTLEQRIGRWFSPPLFPVTLAEVPSQLVFHDVPEEAWEIGGLRVDAQAVWHSGSTVGYRVDAGGAALAYIPDHEPALAADFADRSPDWISGYSLAEGAAVLLHDAQYTIEEYAAHIGWGHSSVDDAVAFARIAGARRLLLFHHDPTHGDADLESIEETAHELWDGAEPPTLAAEGMELVVTGGSGTSGSAA